MMFVRLFVVLLTIMLCLPASWAGPSPSLHLNVKSFQLENGMLFLVVERPTVPQVACRIAIRAGSALEDAGRTGIAHLLEHMMFKGTKNFGTLDPERDQALQSRIEAAYQVILGEERKRNPDKDLIQEKREEMERLRLEVRKIFVPHSFSAQLERNGAVGVNAYTTKDQTQYMASVPSDMLELWFSMISEQLFEPSWREFYVEKEVVRREWAFRYVNDPAGAAWLDLYATAYTAHPYRNPTIGWESDMALFNTRDAQAFHERFYNPSNAVCVLVGDVNAERARDLARIYFGRYPAGFRAPERVTEEPPQSGPRKRIRFLKGARTPMIRIAFHGAKMGTGDFYALDVLTMILSHGRSARLDRRVVDKGLAVSAWAYNPDNRYGGMVVLGGSPNEPKSGEGDRRKAYIGACEELERRLLLEVEELKKEPVSSRELERVRKLTQRDFLDKMKSNEDLAGTLATLEVQVGWRYINTYLAEIRRVTAQDVQRVARRYFREENRTTVYVVPGGKPERPPETYTEVRSAGGASLHRPESPALMVNHSRFPTPKGWRHPLSFRRKPRKIRYPAAVSRRIRGAQVFYLPDHELPLVDMTVRVKAGSVDLPDAQTGLTGLLNGTLIRGGTEKYPPEELARILDENAVRISVSAGEESSAVHLSVLREDWGLGLGLLEEILLRPRFDPSVFEAVKRRALAGLTRQGGNARAVAAREAKIWRFKGHPYGRDPLMGLRTIPGIREGDLRKFISRYFRPSNMVISVAGDLSPEEAFSGIEHMLASFPQEAVPERKLQAPPETPPVLALIHKPGQVQSQVVLSLRSVDRHDPNYWKISLLSDILGGSGSLMVTRLRDDLGLIYAGWAYQAFKWKAGMVLAYLGCKGDQTARALRETAQILDSLRRTVPGTLLEQKRLDALNSFVFNVDSPSELVDVYGRYFLRGEPLDTLERIQDAYMEASAEDLRRLAERFLDPRRLQVFVVADKNTLVVDPENRRIPLESALKDLAQRLGLPFREIALR